MKSHIINKLNITLWRLESGFIDNKLSITPCRLESGCIDNKLRITSCRLESGFIDNKRWSHYCFTKWFSKTSKIWCTEFKPGM